VEIAKRKREKTNRTLITLIIMIYLIGTYIKR